MTGHQRAATGTSLADRPPSSRPGPGGARAGQQPLQDQDAGQLSRWRRSGGGGGGVRRWHPARPQARPGAEPPLVLVDGILPLRCWPGLQRCVVRGDSHSPAIAAASVIAKVARDALIGRLAERYPGYGLERHAGYGTALHRGALEQLGLTPLHRRSFLRKLLAAQPSG